MNFLSSFILTFILFTLFDLSWIFMNIDYYMTLSKKIQKEPFVFKLLPMILAYVVLGISLYLYIKFILFEINANKSMNKYLIAFGYGLLFGLSIYGTYSLTSCVYYKNYGYYDAFKDTAWGMILFTISGLIFVKLYKH